MAHISCAVIGSDSKSHHGRQPHINFNQSLQEWLSDREYEKSLDSALT